MPPRRRPALLCSLLVIACTEVGREGPSGSSFSTTGASESDSNDDATTADETAGEQTDDATTDGESETDGEEPLDACGGCPDPQLCEPELGCLDCEAEACPDAILYAAPDGRGDACSFAEPCTLHTAQAQARSRTFTQAGDVVIYLRGGTYWLGEVGPLTLDPDLDSGQNGFAVVYRAFPGEQPVLSGARPVSGWQLVDANANIYRADSAAPGSRHLIVDGHQAQRARGVEAPAGFIETATGYVAPDAALAAYQYPEALELVGYREWKSFRCPIAGIAGTTITVAPGCWQNAQWHQGDGFDFTLNLPQWFENAPELLDAPGEFFRAVDGSYVDYIPRPGQTLAELDAREPVLTHVIEGLGTPGAPVHDLRFEGLEFADTTWALGLDGFAELQAGIHHVGAQVQAKMPAAVSVAVAQRVSFVDSRFTRLGAAGLSLGAGSNQNSVRGCVFDGIAGIAVQLGDVRETWHHHPDDPAQVTRANTIRDNFITRVGLEYPGSPGIWVGYAEQTVIATNDLFDLSYTGISVGWGWGGVDVGGAGGFLTPAASGSNLIEDNRVGYYMRTLRDGGGIYVLGAQANSFMRGNYVYNQGDPYGALYLDNGTQHYVVRDNVVEKVPYWMLCQTWSTNAINNQMIDNYTELDNPYTANPHPSNVIANNVVFGASLPAAAAVIVDESGLSPEYRGLHPDDVARARPVSASSSWPGYPPELAVDGEGKSGWSPLGSNEDADAWLQVDLGAPTAIAKIEVVTRWDLDQPGTRTNLELLGSDDPSFANAEVLARTDAVPLRHRGIWAARVDGQAYRYVRVRRQDGGYMFVAELRVLAED